MKIILDEAYDRDSKKRRKWFKENILDKLYSFRSFVTIGLYSTHKPLSDCIFQDIDISVFGVNRSENYIHPIYNNHNNKYPVLRISGFEIVGKNDHSKIQYIFNDFESSSLTVRIAQIFNELSTEYPDAEILF